LRAAAPSPLPLHQQSVVLHIALSAKLAIKVIIYGAESHFYGKNDNRFGLILGQLAILKKKFWADYEQLLRAVFSCFQGQKEYLKLF
jgi:hypothetical protein